MSFVLSQVAKLKKNIEYVFGASTYPAVQQILIHKGKVLKDETTMEANKVLEKSVITVTMTKVRLGLVMEVWGFGFSSLDVRFSRFLCG